MCVYLCTVSYPAKFFIFSNYTKPIFNQYVLFISLYNWLPLKINLKKGSQLSLDQTFPETMHFSFKKFQDCRHLIYLWKCYSQRRGKKKKQNYYCVRKRETSPVSSWIYPVSHHTYKHIYILYYIPNHQRTKLENGQDVYKWLLLLMLQSNFLRAYSFALRRLVAM